MRREVAGRANLVVANFGRSIGERHAEDRDDLILHLLGKRTEADDHVLGPLAIDCDLDLIVPLRQERRARHLGERPLRRQPQPDRRRNELLGAGRDLAMHDRRAHLEAVFRVRLQDHRRRED